MNMIYNSAQKIFKKEKLQHEITTFYKSLTSIYSTNLKSPSKLIQSTRVRECDGVSMQSKTDKNMIQL